MEYACDPGRRDAARRVSDGGKPRLYKHNARGTSSNEVSANATSSNLRLV
jgi:hypothetical protein